MLPTLRPADLLLVSSRARVRPGDLVVARPLACPELLVVKRARVDLGACDWDVTADNLAVQGRGWTSGPASVQARVLCRWWPLLPRRRVERLRHSGPSG